MKELSDTYRTLSKPSEQILFKEKKSKFFGYAFPIQSVEEVKPIIESLRKKHHTAGHVCYAWQLGTMQLQYRANDDGEPNNSAGQPIYGQIKAFDVTNVLVAVARIYGGTKLGVGGLITAYRTGAQLALESSAIVEKLIENIFTLSFEYVEMNKVMRILKQKQCEIIAQRMEMDCKLTVAVRKSESENFKRTFEELHKVKLKEIN